MAKKKNRQLTDEEKSPLGTFAAEYWKTLGPEVTGSGLFVDACTILDCHDPKYQDRILDFLDREGSSYRFFTTTYVVAEIVRRLIAKVATYPFVGPNGERYTHLASYVMKDFMEIHRIHVINVPIEIFELGKLNFEKHKNRYDLGGWSLTDAISYEIVHGLRQTQILTTDMAFRTLGLMPLPH